MRKRLNLTRHSCHIDRSCVVKRDICGKKFQTSRNLIVNFHIASLPSNRPKYMRSRYYEDSREFERTRRFLPRTIWKSCKLGANLSQEKLGREVLVRTRRKNLIQQDYLTIQRVAFVGVLSYTKEKYFMREKRDSRVREKSVRNSNRYIFRMLSTTWL